MATEDVLLALSYRRRVEGSDDGQQAPFHSERAQPIEGTAAWILGILRRRLGREEPIHLISGTQPITTSPFFEIRTAWPVARSTKITLG